MSAIGGILNFSNTGVDEELLLSLTERLAHRGPDGAFHVLCNSIGMFHLAFHTSRDSLHETQPFVSPTRQMLAWDGRLDNRDDLVRELAADLRDDRSDVALVMAAFLRWGAD